MSLPIVGQQNATQIRVIIKNHSEQVVSFALVPIRCSPDARHTRYVWVVFIHDSFQTNTMKLRSRKQVIVYFEARFFFRPTIEAADVGKEIEFQTRRSFKKRANVDDVLAGNDQRRFAKRFDNFADPASVLAL